MRTNALQPGLMRLFSNLENSSPHQAVAVDELLALKCDKSFVQPPEESDAALPAYKSLRGTVDRGDALRLPPPCSSAKGRTDLLSLLAKRPNYETVSPDVADADRLMRTALQRINNDLRLIHHKRNAQA